MTYNKTLCEALLMSENDLHDDALSRYGTCIDLYYQRHGTIPVEPLLYKIVLLTKIALQSLDKDDNNCEQDESSF